MTDSKVSIFKLGSKCPTCGKKREGEPSDCWCSAPFAMPEKKCCVCGTSYDVCSDPRDLDADKINSLHMCKDCVLNWVADHYCTNCDQKPTYPGDNGLCSDCR